jgi:hypothetical protein
LRKFEKKKIKKHKKEQNKHNKNMKMKKFILVFLCVCFSFVLVACENQTNLQTAYLSDVTGAFKTDYSIKVVLDNDDRVNEKYVDLQIMSSADEQVLKFGEENGDAYTICLPKKNFWYNLTYLISKTNGTGVEAGYQTYKDYGNKIYNFTTANDVDLKFRVVVGQMKENEETQEQILVLSECVSNELTVSAKKHKDD